MKKRNLNVDKTYAVLVTNDGWLVSDKFCNPIFVRKELNMTL